MTKWAAWLVMTSIGCSTRSSLDAGPLDAAEDVAPCDACLDAASDAPTGCTGLGEPCASNAQCCSLVCDGSCSPSACLAELSPCTADGEACCSFQCDLDAHTCPTGP